MAVEIKVPEMGESIVEGQIGRWLKQEGQRVEKDEPLVEIETDKVTQELFAPVAGVLSKVAKQEGDDAKVGEIIAYLEEGAQASESAPQSTAATETAKAPASQADASGPQAPEATPADQGQQAQPAQQRDSKQMVEKPDDKSAQASQHVMPAARRLLDEHGLSAQQVQATGPGGRLLKDDVQRHVQQQDQTPAQPAAPSQPQTQPQAGDRDEEVVPMTPLRRSIARRLVEAQQTGALLTTFNEIDMSAVLDLRGRYKQGFQDRYGIKLGFMSFFVKASVDALKQFPAVNGEVRGTDIVYKNYFDIGIAIGSGKGLVVPILRNAERMSFADVELAIGEFADRVKNNALKLQDLQGGTFTITNGGVFGSLLSTPIVNPPQSAVLGMHSIQQRPVAIDGKVEIRPMMYVALTYDHRLVDGREAVTFLNRIKQAIEDPTRMLMEV